MMSEMKFVVVCVNQEGVLIERPVVGFENMQAALDYIHAPENDTGVWYRVLAVTDLSGADLRDAESVDAQFKEITDELMSVYDNMSKMSERVGALEKTIDATGRIVDILLEEMMTTIQEVRDLRNANLNKAKGGEYNAQCK